MTKSNTRLARLVADAGQRPCSLNSALNQLRKAHAEHTRACATYSVAEISKADDEELRKIEQEAVAPASDAVGEAEKAVLAAPVHGEHDVLRKVGALLDEAMFPETVEALRRDITAVLDTESDPVVNLCEEWLRINRYLNQQAHDESIEWDELHDRSLDLLRRIEETVPTTTKGLALMLSVMWHSEGPSIRPGCEGWEEAMNAPEARLLSRMRRGAYALAGIES